MQKVILITGCSTGIGHDLAARLIEAGDQVIATARQVETLQDLRADLKITLDVTSSDSVDQAVSSTIARFGRIDILVNNAGYGIRSVVEETTGEQVQKIFDVNVFGALRMIRAVVPHMRKQGGGRIINISSIAGRVVTPVNGIYSATKFSLEAISDALRWELAPFSIQVVLIEPGAIKTRFDDTFHAAGKSDNQIAISPYKAIYQKIEDFAVSMRSKESGPEVVSRVVMQAISTPRPRARYLAGVGFPASLALAFRDQLWDLIAGRAFRV